MDKIPPPPSGYKNWIAAYREVTHLNETATLFQVVFDRYGKPQAYRLSDVHKYAAEEILALLDKLPDFRDVLIAESELNMCWLGSGSAHRVLKILKNTLESIAFQN